MRALVTMLALTFAVPAFACDMEAYEEETGADRIATARDYLDEDMLEEAAEYARSVAIDKHENRTLRAEAYALAAVIRWKQDRIETAKLNLKKARELDQATADKVVAKLKRADEKALLAAVGEP